MAADELSGMNVLVSGAGAAGQTVAYWLARYGAHVTVVERAPAPRTGGFATDIRGSALAVAEWMGVVDKMRQARVSIREMVRLDAAGERIWEMRGNFGIGYETGDIEILRDDLTSILASAMSTVDNHEYVFGDSVTALEQDEGGVEVSFKTGSAARYDLVVGADGLHSNVRTLAFGPESVFAKPFGKYVGIWTMPNLFDLDSQWYFSYLPGTLVAVMQYGREKHTRGMVIFNSSPLKFDRQDPDAPKAILHELLKDHHQHWGVRELLETLDAATDLFFDDITQIHMPTWSKGRVALVGDAAHAPTLMSGQGTSVALVGGYVLASELARGGDHTVAFPAYEAAMRHYVELNQAIPDQSEEFRLLDSWEEIRVHDEAVKEMLQAAADIPTTERQDDGTTATFVAKAANAIELSIHS